jgi:hypothetical protein
VKELGVRVFSGELKVRLRPRCYTTLIFERPSQRGK